MLDETWIHYPAPTPEQDHCRCESVRGLIVIERNAAIDREYRALERDVWKHGKEIFRLAPVYPEWEIVKEWMECHSGPRVTQTRSAWPLWEMQARRYGQRQMPGSYGG